MDSSQLSRLLSLQAPIPPLYGGKTASIGPSLAEPPFNLTNVLQNPSLSLFHDDWQNDQRDEIIATGLQPCNTAESALSELSSPATTLPLLVEKMARPASRWSKFAA